MALSTIGDIFTEVLVRNNRTTTDSFITDAMLQDWVQDAHVWATSAYKWPFTEGRVSTTYVTSTTDELGNAVMNYPEGWKSDSTRIMTIGGKRMTKLNFEDLLSWKEDNASSAERFYSDYNRQYFINANADVSGTLTVYGQYLPNLDATDLTALTLFSGYDEEGNDAIVEKMTAYLKRREHLPDEAQLHEQVATQKLQTVWEKIAQEQYKYKTVGDGIYQYFDVLSGNPVSDFPKRDQF